MRTGQTYRGWIISYDPPPIPVRTCDYSAVHPDYDGECGRHVFGGSVTEVQAEIDNWYDENA